MKSINSLLDGTTIVNLPMYLRLFKRYKKMSISILVITLLIAFSLYFFQATVMSTSITFSDISSASSDPSMKALSAFLGDSKDNQKSLHILGLKKSMDFSRKIVDKVMQHESFLKMRFDLSFFGNRKLKAKNIAEKCKNDQTCIRDILAEIISDFYEITDKDRTGAVFTLEVKSLDELTSTILLEEIEKSILEARSEVLKVSITHQEKKSLEMLSMKKKELNDANFESLMEQKNRLDSRLIEINSKLEVQNRLFTEVKSSLAGLEARVDRSKSVVESKVEIDEIEKEKARKAIRDRIERLNSDLLALENTNIAYNEKDQTIIASIKTELTEKKRQLESMGTGNKATSMDAFLKTSEGKIDSTELDYKVVKGQHETLQKYYDQQIKEKNRLLDAKIKVEESLDRLKTSVIFVKELEAKVEQLKLLKFTISSDVRFDTFPKPPEDMKKVGLLLIFAYSNFLYLFNLFFALTIRFLLDDTVYDEEDLAGIKDDLKIIGIAPRYD